MSKIRYIPSKKIDRIKWNQSIENAEQPLFYGLAEVYDKMCSNWAGLVLGDYEAVMPIAFKYKWRLFPYIYQPFFIQQSGIFSALKTDSNLVQQFLNNIPLRFIRVHHHFNYANEPSKKKGFFTKRSSFELDLNKCYETLFKNYSKDARKNLNRLVDEPLTFNEEESISSVFQNYRSTYGNLNPRIQDIDYKRFEKLIEILKTQDKLFVLGIYKEGVLLGNGVFVHALGRIHYVLGAPTPLGRELNITHLLIDKVIQKFSNQPIHFDFEGSDIPSVASFYKKFNSEKRIYYQFARGI